MLETLEQGRAERTRQMMPPLAPVEAGAAIGPAVVDGSRRIDAEFGDQRRALLRQFDPARPGREGAALGQRFVDQHPSSPARWS